MCLQITSTVAIFCLAASMSKAIAAPQSVLAYTWAIGTRNGSNDLWPGGGYTMQRLQAKTGLSWWLCVSSAGLSLMVRVIELIMKQAVMKKKRSGSTSTRSGDAGVQMSVGVGIQNEQQYSMALL